MSPEPTDPPAVLRVRNLSKAFPGVQALDDIGFDLRAGEVHAVLGENGAGKSTLMRILAGLEQPDRGEIFLCGRRCRFRNAHDAITAGISMIHQELMPFQDLSVAENIFMGRELCGGFGFLRVGEEIREAGRFLELVCRFVQVTDLNE